MRPQWKEQGRTWRKAVLHSQIEAVFIYTPLSSISVLTAILNLLVIISIAHFKQLHTPNNLLLLSLAVSDFFVGLIMACQISLLDGCWFLGDHMCALYSSLDYIATSASVGTMVLISADRYVAICDPLHYPTKITIKRARAMRSHITALRLQGSETVHAKKSELKAARTLGVLVIAFLICLFPFFCSSMVGQNSFFDIRSVPFERMLFYFNSCLNPLIYTFCYPWFLKSIKLIVTFKIFRHGSSEASIL
ncbi:cytoplasmic tRNA 2-thiolation protein 1 [Sarotherodon galilaeus]